MCNYSWSPISLHVRVVPSRPIRRTELIKLLNSLAESTQSGLSDLTVLTYSECLGVIPQRGVAKDFLSLGGVLIKSVACRKFCDGRNLLCDFDFWRLWDVIVFSGWCCLDVKAFNSLVKSRKLEYIALVRRDPRTSSLMMPSSNVLPCSDPRCVERLGYGVFSDIQKLFSKYCSDCVWFGHRAFPWPRGPLWVRYQQKYFEYQVELIGRLIMSRQPIPTILKLILEINAYGISFTVGLPDGINLNCVDDLSVLLTEELFSLVHFSHFDDELRHLLSFCDVDNL